MESHPSALPRPAFHRAEPDARRHSLIAACAAVLASRGAAGTSVRAVAREAGVSPGLIGHYFGGIDALVGETYAHVDGVVRNALAEAVARAGTDPRARLDAFVTASFAPPIAEPALLATWLAFWSLVVSNPAIAREHDGQYAGFRGALETLMGEAGLAVAHRAEAAIAVTALVDGLWLELCLSPGSLDAARAGAIARRFLDTFYPASSGSSTVK